MENTTIQERQDRAWKMLQDSELTLGNILFIRSAFAPTYKEDYPFISQKHKNGEIEYYHSQIEAISHYNFLSEKEVVLANAIYENIKDNFKPNTFVQQLKFTFRILGVDSIWSK